MSVESSFQQNAILGMLAFLTAYQSIKIVFKYCIKGKIKSECCNFDMHKSINITTPTQTPVGSDRSTDAV